MIDHHSYKAGEDWAKKYPRLVKFINKHEHPFTILLVTWTVVKFFALLPFTVAQDIYYSMRDQ